MKIQQETRGRLARLLDRIVSGLWRFCWQHWLNDKDVVVKVKGWRTALVDRHGYTRQRITPMFPWEKCNH